MEHTTWILNLTLTTVWGLSLNVVYMCDCMYLGVLALTKLSLSLIFQSLSASLPLTTAQTAMSVHLCLFFSLGFAVCNWWNDPRSRDRQRKADVFTEANKRWIERERKKKWRRERWAWMAQRFPPAKTTCCTLNLLMYVHQWPYICAQRYTHNF